MKYAGRIRTDSRDGYPNQRGGKKPRGHRIGDRNYTNAQAELMRAVEAYKVKHNIRFPSVWEIVCVAVESGIVAWRPEHEQAGQ